MERHRSGCRVWKGQSTWKASQPQTAILETGVLTLLAWAETKTASSGKITTLVFNCSLDGSLLYFLVVTSACCIAVQLHSQSVFGISRVLCDLMSSGWLVSTLLCILQAGRGREDQWQMGNGSSSRYPWSRNFGCPPCMVLARRKGKYLPWTEYNCHNCFLSFSLLAWVFAFKADVMPSIDVQQISSITSITIRCMCHLHRLTPLRLCRSTGCQSMH